MPWGLLFWSFQNDITDERESVDLCVYYCDTIDVTGEYQGTHEFTVHYNDTLELNASILE